MAAVLPARAWGLDGYIKASKAKPGTQPGFLFGAYCLCAVSGGRQGPSREPPACDAARQKKDGTIWHFTTARGMRE